MSDLTGHVWFRQVFSKGPNPSIHQRVVGIENFPHHPERPFGHGVQQYTQSFLGGNFIVRARISLSEIISAIFAFIALLAGHNPVFNHLFSGTVLTSQHNAHLHLLGGGNLQ